MASIPSKPIGQSNLDLTGLRIVKRGDLVSWYGLRFKVSKVRRGVVYPDKLASLVPPSFHFVACKAVQVVA